MMTSDEIMAFRGPAYAKNNQRRRSFIIVALIIVVVVVVVSVVATKDGKESKAAVQEANDEAEEKDHLRLLIGMALDKLGVETQVLDVENSYQLKAFEWLSQDQDLANYDRSQVLQRFALACFYHATNSVSTLYTLKPVPWKRMDNWLTNQNECQWQGIRCSSELKVDAINLEDNGLSGSLPIELALLRDHLAALDLSRNQLFIEGSDWDVFGRLTNLELLLMDSNFLSTPTGLPSSLGRCTRLQRLGLSHNLIGGELDAEVLQKFTKLTDLDIESNFLEGSIPPGLGEMEQLVYLYLGRNDFHCNLDFLKPGKLTSLFAMRLDANDLVGTIPTEIGLLSNLASLSASNGTLTGTIPTEFGKLTGLRRMWLYGNGLTGTLPTELASLRKLEVVEVHRNSLLGTVPRALCNTIAASTYLHKSLAVDCAKISCEECCTRCE